MNVYLWITVAFVGMCGLALLVGRVLGFCSGARRDLEYARVVRADDGTQLPPPVRGERLLPGPAVRIVRQDGQRVGVESDEDSDEPELFI